jgi:hypothetical protein
VIGSFSFWVASLVFPLILLALNAVIRWLAKMHQSAAGDLIMLFGAFDGAVILQADEFAPFSHHLPDANDLRAWFLIVLIFNIVFWGLAVLRIERAMYRDYDHITGRYLRSPTWGMIGYLALSAATIVLNTAAFTVR